MLKYLTILIVLLLAPLAALHAATPPAKPNIVLIFSDDHAIQAIGAYGARLSEFCKQHGVNPLFPFPDRLSSVVSV
jgi:hypothetical protein